jgi:hypothetical protein
MSDNPFDEFKQVSNNPFDEFKPASPNPRDVLSVAMAVNPDQAAEAARLAKRYPASSDVLLRNLTQARAQALVDDADAKLATSPALAAQMRDVAFAQQSHDDVGVLARVENALVQTGRSAKSGVYGASRGAAGTFQAGAELIAPVLDPLERVTAIGGNPLRRLAEGFARLGQQNLEVQKGLRPKGEQSVGAAGYFSGVESLSQNLLALPVAFLNPAASLAMMTASTGGNSYQDARDKGLGMPQALPFAASQAAIEYATEKLPLTKLLGDVKAGAPILQTIAKQFALEMPREQIATVLQDLNEWAVLNPDKPFSSYIEERPSAAAQTFIATLVGTGGNVAVAKAIESVATRVAQRDADVQQSDRDLQKFEAALNAAAESKLRGRAPETFAQFVRQAAENTDVAPTSVYMDARTLTDALNQAGISDEQLAQLLPSVPDQIASAFESGGTVEIPIGEALAAVPGTPLEQVLLQNARMEPDGLSRTEVDEATKQADQFVKDEADRVMQSAQAETAMNDSVDEVVKAEIEKQVGTIRSEFISQFKEAVKGNSKLRQRGVAEAYARLVGATFRALANRTGMTPAEMYARFPLRVQGEMQAGALEQRAPGTLYHGTTSDVSKFSRTEGGNMWGPGYYLTDDPNTASGYAIGTAGGRIAPKGNAAPNVMPVRLDDGELFDMAAPLSKKTLRRVEKAIGEKLKGYTWSGMKNRDLRQVLFEQFTDQAGANKALADAGFVGLAENNLTAGPGRTVMVFDAKVIRSDITGETLAQQTRATFSPEQMLIALGPKADYSSFLHEMGHFWLEVHADLAGQPDAPQQIVDDFNTTLAWFGITGTEQVGGSDAGGVLGQREHIYHGTSPEVALAIESAGFDVSKSADGTIWFTSNPDIGEVAATQSGAVIARVLDTDSLKLGGWAESDQYTADQLIAMGYDGLRLEDDGETTYQIFNPEKLSKPDALAQGGQPTDAPAVQPQRTPLETWRAMTLDQKRPYHERWAESVEQYIFEGKAPSVELSGAFSRFVAWMTDVYKSFKQFLASRAATPGEAPAGELGQGTKPVFDQTQSEAFKKWGNNAPLVTSEDAATREFKTGEKVVVEAYHGTKRPDRVGTKFLKKRATSGPMAYHTSDPSLASNYASGKQDTSLANEEQDYSNWFKVKLPGERSASDLVRSWYRLTPEQKNKIADLASRVMFSEEQEVGGGNKIELGPEGHDSGTGSYDYNLAQTRTSWDRRGNPLKALVEDWLNSGNLFNDEERFMQVLKLAGFPMNVVEYDSPTSEYPFVYKNYIAMQKPLVTSDIPQDVVAALDAAAKRDRNRARPAGADLWDKNTRTLKQWVSAFHSSADSAYVWTSIPDKVTEVFKSLGYDGIIDWSGKGGGAIVAPVYIPFEETQVKSALGNKGKFDDTKNDILKQGGPAGPLALSDEIRAVMDRLLATDEQIAEMERVREYGLLFKSPEEAGMTPEQWAKYTSNDERAHAEALADLNKRSLRDMGIVMRKRMRALKDVQAGMVEKRKAVREEAAAQIAAEPVYRAMRWLKKGEMITVEGDEIKATDGFKLDRAAVDELFPESMPGRPDLAKLRGMAIKEGGLPPDLVAEMFGFRDGVHLITSITEAFPQTDQVEGLTDQMMLERYGDLTTPRGMERAADEAVHNEARARVLAAELAAVSAANNARAPGAGGRTVNAMVQAAKLFAAKLADGKKIKDLKPQHHTAAETRAARAADKALAKGDTQAVIQGKRDQVLQFHAARAVNDARIEALKIEAFLKKIAAAKDEVVGKTRDLDAVKAAQRIVAAYGYGVAKGKTAAEYLEAVKQYDPAMAATIEPSVNAALAEAKPFTELTMDEARALHEELQALWHLAKRSRQMEIDGNLLDLEEVTDDLKARLLAIGIPESMPGDVSAITPAEQRALKLKHYLATARRVESWAQGMDGSEKIGVFRRYVWQPVKEAADAYRAEKAKYLKQYRELLKAIEPTLAKRQIDAPELGYVFGKDTDGVAMAEILHAVLHTGNESNKRKLLLGRKWAVENADGTLDTSRWDAFVQRLVDEGTLRPSHFDFAQGVWDLLESTKPQAQKTHRDVFGRYFKEVTADGFADPFGIQRRGGYVPAMADSRIVSDAATRKLMEDENASLQFAFPSTAKGFTKSRVEYNRPLLLDLRSLGQHIDKVLLFSHMESPVRDVRKALTAKGVAYGLNRIDPAAFDKILTPWLNRAAKQLVAAPVPNSWQGWRMWTTLRNRAGAAAMFGNLANAVQQFAGFSLAAVKVNPTRLAAATAQYIAAPRATAEMVASKSIYMDRRLANEVANMNDAINDILINPGVYEKTQRFLQRHAYFLQQGIDNVMGPIIWTGAYNQALEQGVEERDAIRLADSAVRETQGAVMPEDISAFEEGTPFSRIFTQFAGYFNMQANLLGTEFQTIAREMGLRKGLGRGLYVMVFGFMVNAWVAEAVMQAFRGGPDDEDKDGAYWDDWLAQVFGWSMLRNAAAGVPVFGQAGNSLVNAFNAKPYDDRLASSPAISMLESAARAPQSVYKVVVEDGKPSKAIRDVGTATAMLLGLPLTPIVKPLSYLSDVADSRVHSTGPIDAVRGAITGTPSPESKR